MSSDDATPGLRGPVLPDSKFQIAADLVSDAVVSTLNSMPNSRPRTRHKPRILMKMVDILSFVVSSADLLR